MATGPCPACRQSITIVKGQRSVICEHCGAVFQVVVKDGKRRLKRIDTRETKERQGISPVILVGGIGTLGVLAIIAILMIVLLVNSTNQQDVSGTQIALAINSTRTVEAATVVADNLVVTLTQAAQPTIPPTWTPQPTKTFVPFPTWTPLSTKLFQPTVPPPTTSSESEMVSIPELTALLERFDIRVVEVMFLDDAVLVIIETHRTSVTKAEFLQDIMPAVVAVTGNWPMFDLEGAQIIAFSLVDPTLSSFGLVGIAPDDIEAYLQERIDEETFINRWVINLTDTNTGGEQTNTSSSRGQSEKSYSGSLDEWSALWAAQYFVKDELNISSSWILGWCEPLINFRNDLWRIDSCVETGSGDYEWYVTMRYRDSRWYLEEIWTGQ